MLYFKEIITREVNRLAPLFERLSLPPSHTVIAAVGSGGKTTCLKALAHSYLAASQTVLLTTTTRMRREWADVSLTTCQQMKKRLEQTPFLFAGSPAPSGKLGPLAEDVLSKLSTLAQIVLIEADGSKELPMKYPASWEPVLPKETGHVLVLFGLSALGKPLQEVCHRWELAAVHFGWDGDAVVTPEMAAAAIYDGYLAVFQQHKLPFTVVLNQADQAAQEEMDRLICALSPARCVALSLKDEPLMTKNPDA